MKITITFFIAITVLVSCSHHLNRGGRFIASNDPLDCSDAIKEIIREGNFAKLDGDVDQSLAARRERTRLIKEGLERGDFNTVHEQVVKSHDNQGSYSILNLLKGRSPRLEKRLWKLRRSSDAFFVPMFYQNSAYSDKAVFSTILHLVGDKRLVGKAETEKALKEVDEWIEDYKGYINRLEVESLAATEASIHIKNLKEFSKQVKDSDFPIGILVNLDDGSYQVTKDFNAEPPANMRLFPFELRGSLKATLEEQERIKESAFAGSFAADKFHKSRMYKVFYDHAINFRRLQLAARALQRPRSGSGPLSSKQKEMRDKIISVLEDPNYLRPRSNAVKRLQKREVRAEWRAKWSFIKSKRVLADEKFPLPVEMQEKLEKVSPAGFIARYLSIGAGISGVSAILAFSEEIPYVEYVYAYIENMKNDFVLWALGTNSALRACKDADRNWTLDEVSLNNFVNAHTSRFIHLNNFSEKDYNEEEWLKEKRHELRELCIIERAKKGLAEAHRLNKLGITSAYRGATHHFFMSHFDREYNLQGDERLGYLVNRLLDINAVYGAELESDKGDIRDSWSDEEEEAFKEIAQLNPEAEESLREYLKSLPTALKTMRDFGSMPKSKNLQEFLEHAKETYTP